MKPLILWGGTDISSHLYNEPKSKFSQTADVQRDKKEWASISDSIDNKQPIVGICRGAQLLCAYNGGKLYQHTVPQESHNHAIQTKEHFFYSVAAGHHQIMNLSLCEEDYEILGVNPTSVAIFAEDSSYIIEHDTIEIVWFPKTRCLAVQPHPEWEPNDTPFLKWLNETMKKLGIYHVF